MTSQRITAMPSSIRKLLPVAIWIAVLSGSLVLINARSVPAQSSTVNWEAAAGGKMAFDVVSIKLNTTGGEICTKVAFSCAMDLGKPGRLTVVNQPLRILIEAAYHLSPWQTRIISGLPKWIDAQRFDIQATAEGNPDLDQKRMMLQSLLADRFKLAVHHETRRGPVYALMLEKAGKTGPGLVQHSDAAACSDFSKGTPRHQPVPGDSICGGFLMLGHGGVIQVTGNNTTMAGLAENLNGETSGDEIGRAVVDRTGLGGSFDVTLKYTVRSQIDSAATTPDPAAPPSLITALQEQLGLKLESQEGSVDVLVIDHVEEPSEN